MSTHTESTELAHVKKTELTTTRQARSTELIPIKQTSLTELGTRIRILELDGKVSREIWLVASGCDRNGKVVVVREDTAVRDESGALSTEVGCHRNVNRRRLLPLSSAEAVTVVESGDRFKAMCPRCGASTIVSPASEQVECADHGVFPLYWLGVKPMSDHRSKQRAPAPKTVRIEAKPPIKAKPDPAQHQSYLVDFPGLRSVGELWTRKHVAFDHANIDVQAHVLLTADGDSHRKYYFNTYDGSLGKKAKPFVLQEFLQTMASNPLKSSLDAERARLTKLGYELSQDT